MSVYGESRHRRSQEAVVAALTEANVRHLLRRTEIVDKPHRVAELLALSSLEAAVDDVMTVSGPPVPVSYAGIRDSNFERGVRVGEHWMGEMARISRPFAERMGFFWHGHFVSSVSKVGHDRIADQIDLFRTSGLGSEADGGNVADLIKATSIQPAMLRYLDNDRNGANSPNQNFARELMELFLLGVGNYEETDVEAATAAWTGHGLDWSSGTNHVFRSQYHESAPQTFLGRRINAGAPEAAGNETIDVMLGTGSVGTGAVRVGPNAGRPTDEVCADFLGFKLWQEFGEAVTGGVPAGVRAAMRSALIGSGFDIRPWVRAMLLHDDFYTSTAKTGLVRQPVDYMVATLVASGLPGVGGSHRSIPYWLMRDAGQQILYPPNVSGWKTNSYWINTSTMSSRHSIADHCLWQLSRDTYAYNGGNGFLQFGDDPSRRITRTEVESLPPAELVDRLAACCLLELSASTRARIIDHISHPSVKKSMRLDALLLMWTAPEMHAA